MKSIKLKRSLSAATAAIMALSVLTGTAPGTLGKLVGDFGITASADAIELTLPTVAESITAGEADQTVLTNIPTVDSSNATVAYYYTETEPGSENLALPESTEVQFVEITDGKVSNVEANTYYVYALIDPAEGNTYSDSDETMYYYVGSFAAVAAVPATFTVTFNSHEGSPVGSITDVANGNKISKPTDPTKTDYVFAGWYKSYNGETQQYSDEFNFDSDTITSDTTLHAKWVAEHTVTFNANYGLDPSTASVTTNAQGKVKAPEIERTGYTLAGWYTGTVNETTGEVTLAQDAFNFDTVIDNDDLTLYAKWTKGTVSAYTITLNGNGGYFDEEEQNATNVSDSLTAPTTLNEYIETKNFDNFHHPEKINDSTLKNYRKYAFGGWYDAADGNTKVNGDADITSNATVYAHWVNAMTIDFDMGHVTLTAQGKQRRPGFIENEAVKVTGSVSMEGKFFEDIDTVTKENCTFKGWDILTDSVDTLYTTAQLKSYDFGSDPVVVKAIWDEGSTPAETYTVTLKNATSPTSGNTTHSVEVGSEYTLPTEVNDYEDPTTHIIYEFKGWYTNEGLTSAAEATVSSAATVYAKWAKKTFTLTFNQEDAALKDKPAYVAQTITSGDLATAVAAPEKENLAFGGWYTDENCETAFDFAADKIAEDTTLYAKWVSVYAVTFDPCEGTIPEEVDGQALAADATYTAKSDVNKKVTPPADPTKTGYTFDGWYTLESGGDAFNFSTGEITEATTLYAHWTAKVFNIEVVGDNVDFGSTYASTAGFNYNKMSFGTEKDLTIAAASGYTLPSTIEIVYGTSSSAETKLTLSDDYTYNSETGAIKIKTAGIAKINAAANAKCFIKAAPTATEYSITYNYGGLTPTTPAANPVEYTTNSNDITLQAPEKTGYDFGGWFEEASFTTPITKIEKGSTGNKTIYGKWTVGITRDLTNVSSSSTGSAVAANASANYTETLTPGAGYALPSTITVTIGGQTATPGENFEGDAAYTYNSTSGVITIKNTAITGPVVITAEGAAQTYTVTFNANGGVGDDATEDFEYGATAKKLTKNTFTKQDCTFVCWNTKADGTGTSYTDEQVVGNFTENTTLYAIWKGNEDYTLTYDLDGGTYTDSEKPLKSSVNASTDDFTIGVPVKTGYTFTGWTVTGASTGLTVDSSAKTIAVDCSAVANDLTFTATWSLTSYTITYNDNGTTTEVTTPATYNINTADITLGTPVKAGYTFGGWYTGSNGSGSQVTSIPKGSTGNKVVYGNWTKDVYTIKYHNGTATVAYNATPNMWVDSPGTHPGNYSVDTATITLAALEPTGANPGFAFAGWYDNAELTGEPVTQITLGSTGNKEFYAKWGKAFTVTPGDDNVTGLAGGNTVVDIDQSVADNTVTYKDKDGTEKNVQLGNIVVAVGTINGDYNATGQDVAADTITNTLEEELKAENSGEAVTDSIGFEVTPQTSNGVEIKELGYTLKVRIPITDAAFTKVFGPGKNPVGYTWHKGTARKLTRGSEWDVYGTLGNYFLEVSGDEFSAFMFADVKAASSGHGSVDYDEVVDGNITYHVYDDHAEVAEVDSSTTSATIKEKVGGKNVTVIGANAFNSCKSLTAVNIPATVTTIENSAFWGCSALTEVTIPKNVTSIDKDAFKKCDKLKTVKGVKGSAAETFAKNAGLTFVEIGAETPVTTLGKATDVAIDANGKVTWTSAENAAEYKVFKKIGSKLYYTGWVKGTEYKFATVPTVDFEVYVAARDADKKTVTYSEHTKVTGTAPLGTATNISVTDKGEVSWTAAANAKYYVVVKVVNGKYYTKTVKSGTSTTISVPVGNYKVYVKAIGQYNTSTKSEVKSVTVKNALGYVNKVTVDADGNVSWDKASNAVAYKVAKVMNGKTYWTKQTDKTSVKITPAKKDYQVYVVAFNKDGKKTWGTKNLVSVTDPGTVIDAKVSGKTVKWTAVKNAVKYKVNKVVTKDGKATTYGGKEITTTSYTFKNAPKSGDRIYVVSYNAEGKKTLGWSVTIK